MTVYWEQHLNQIREQLLMMSGLTERNLEQSIRSLMERNDNMAELVEAQDSEVDDLEKSIDERVITYISTHGPMARDCRFLITASKIASELERIADQATTIARRARDLNRGPELKSLANVPLMAAEVQSMLRQSIKAFVERDTDLALEVIGRDKLVDAEYKEAAREVENSIVADPTTTARELHMLTVAKALERAGD
ncbi:MAG: phosphate signaling complex protein PhoU, partial [Verrucomicrobiota bacterium]